MYNIDPYSQVLIKTDWHNLDCTQNNNLNNKKCCMKYNCCMCCCHCNHHLCKYPKEVILQYIFKEQIYYSKCKHPFIHNYFPSTISNGKTFLMHNNLTYIGSTISSSIVGGEKINSVPVEYPDYSKTDVGKGKKWPAKVFAPYVDTTAWPTYNFIDTFNKYKVPYFNLGFIVTKSYNVCLPSWATYYPAEAGPVNDQIKQLRDLGGDVCVSFGGAAGMPIHINCPDADSLFKQYQLFCDAYGLTRIDFDIEGTWISSAYSAQNLNNANALKKLQDYYKGKGESIDIWFTLPILPTGLTPDGLNVIKQAKDAGVNIGGINVMTMDYGDSAAPNPSGKMGQYGIQAITSLHSQLSSLYGSSKTSSEIWAMIGTTPMLGVNDVVTEVFKQSDATETLNFAKQNNIGMISMWSSNRDLAGSFVTKITQQPNDFTVIFNAYNS